LLPKSEREKKREKEVGKVAESYPWGDLYAAIVCNVGIAPSEYWRMSPSEVGLVLDFNRPVEYYGELTADEVDDLAEMREKPAPIVNGIETQWI
jgi:hypothetical protein